MPKERRDRSVSRERCRASPYPCSSDLKKWSAELEENAKEWEDARCPVCMEHPHNAVLLICSSHDNGCHPYMCDTSYRHSNCLDQFRKSFSPDPEPEQDQEQEHEQEISTAPAGNPVENPSEAAEAAAAAEARIMCPLCRGEIKEWTVVEPARRFMNTKPRSCSCEKCSFSGAYSELRRHARDEHPGARPSEADPARERSWRRLERQRDLGDLLSTLQSSMAAAGDENSAAGDNDNEAPAGEIPIDDGRWLTVFFLIRVFRSPGSGSRSSSWSGPSRTRAQLSIRRSSQLWGESYDEEEEEEEDEQEDGATETGSSLRAREDDNETSSDEGPGDGRRRSERIRRRTSAPDENQP